MGAQHTPGPYWVRTNTNGSHDVCGRNAKVVRSYMADQVALATEDCRRLQKQHSAKQDRIAKAAPDMLALIEDALPILDVLIDDREALIGEEDEISRDLRERVKALIARATGAA